jgi:uncharacterized protein YkwD
MALTAPHKKHAPHHKKAHAGHHRRSKEYLKTYHPYLPLLLLIIVGLAINIFWTSKTHVLGATSNLTSAELLQETNEERVRHNQDELKLSPNLSQAAQAKAYDMVKKDYWSHTSPSGDKPWEFIKKSGYDYYVAGENLAYGFSDANTTITGWMNSRDHRANVLNADYQEVGFGIVNADNYQGNGKSTVVVAMYAQPALAGLGDFSSIATKSTSDLPYRNVSRVQLLTGGTAPWSYSLITFASLVAAAWFSIRHLKVWHRVVVRSEEFIIHHKILDFVFVLTAVAGFVLTRAAGFIH